MPKLWRSTIEEHRREVREAVVDATARLVDELGIRSVTMSQIAESAGIGRATLYKYFSDVEEILVAWHQRQVAAHLDLLTSAAHSAGRPVDRVRAVVQAYATIEHEHPTGEMAAALHAGDHVAHGEAHLQRLLTHLLAEGVEAGDVRSDVAAKELAAFCVHAARAARAMPSKAAVQRLVRVVMAGLSG